MTDLIVLLASIQSRLNRSLVVLQHLQSIRDCVSEDLEPLFRHGAQKSEMFLLAGNLDSLKCLIDVEIEQVHRLIISCDKANDLVVKNAYERSLAQRLSELAHIDAAIQDGDVSRYVPGLAPAEFEIIDVTNGRTEIIRGWSHWADLLGIHSSIIKDAALKFPSTHPFSPHFGMIINMLNSLFLWCEEQRKLQIAIDVLSKPSGKSEIDYGSFLRLELLELRRQVIDAPQVFDTQRGEEV